MVRNMGVARDLGYLNLPSGLLVDVKALDNLPDRKVVLVCTGSQEEPLAALTRIVKCDHMFRVGEGDTRRACQQLDPRKRERGLPGHQRAHPLGAAVVHKGNSLVHVLGHAAAGELLFLYNIAKPTNVLPSTENDGTYELTAPTRLRRFGRIHRCR